MEEKLPWYYPSPMQPYNPAFANTTMELKKDCYFYDEEPDMGAHIPICNYHGKLGYCPCERCEKFTPKM